MMVSLFHLNRLPKSDQNTHKLGYLQLSGAQWRGLLAEIVNWHDIFCFICKFFAFTAVGPNSVDYLDQLSCLLSIFSNEVLHLQLP